MVADFIKFWEPRRRILTYGLSCDFQVDPDSSVARGLPAGADRRLQDVEELANC